MLVRVISTKMSERRDGFVKTPLLMTYEDYCQLIARRQDFAKSVTDALNYWICDYLSRLRKWLGYDEEPEEMLDIIVRNRRNSFYVASSFMNAPAGCGVYVSPSFFNHSCKPNIFYQSWLIAHTPREFEFCSERDLKKGTELCISYLDDSAIIQDYEKRRAMLIEGFLFTCTCNRCLRDEKQDLLKKQNMALLTQATDAVQHDKTTS